MYKITFHVLTVLNCRGQLVKLGCKVDVAPNGQFALNIVTNNEIEYDLILLDLEMPIKGKSDKT